MNIISNTFVNDTFENTTSIDVSNTNKMRFVYDNRMGDRLYVYINSVKHLVDDTNLYNVFKRINAECPENEVPIVSPIVREEFKFLIKTPKKVYLSNELILYFKKDNIKLRYKFDVLNHVVNITENIEKDTGNGFIYSHKLDSIPIKSPEHLAELVKIIHELANTTHTTIISDNLKLNIGDILKISRQKSPCPVMTKDDKTPPVESISVDSTGRVEPTEMDSTGRVEPTEMDSTGGVKSISKLSFPIKMKLSEIAFNFLDPKKNDGNDIATTINNVRYVGATDEMVSMYSPFYEEYVGVFGDKVIIYSNNLNLQDIILNNVAIKMSYDDSLLICSKLAEYGYLNILKECNESGLLEDGFPSILREIAEKSGRRSVVDFIDETF
jgi:hypothetical protein